MTELNAAVMPAPTQLVQPRQQGEFGQWPQHMAEEDASIQYANLAQQDPVEAKAAEQKAFSLRYTTQFQHVGSDVARAMLCMASITAPPVALNRERSPLDLIAVVDRSGSMHGAKIALVQQALKYLLTQLTPRDRLSVISFDERAYTIFALRAATPEQRSLMSEMVDRHPQMQASGGTNIWQGLSAALCAVRARRLTTANSAIFLLTDGQGGAPTREQLAQSLQTMQAPVPIHCFGFGADHDAKVMAMVAEEGKGSFAYVESEAMVGDAFATCLGGMLSVFAQDISLQIMLPPDAKLAAPQVHSKYRVTQPASGQLGALVAIPDMFCDETRDIVFELVLPRLASPNPQMSLCTLELAWTNAATHTRESGAAVHACVARPEGAGTSETNRVLDLHRNRVQAALAMSEATVLGEAGDLTRARARCDAAMAYLGESCSRDSAAVQALLQDLRACRERFADRRTWEHGGQAFVAQCSSEHWQQRSCSSRTPSYVTPTQRLQQQQNASYSSSSSAASITTSSSSSSSSVRPTSAPAATPYPAHDAETVLVPAVHDDDDDDVPCLEDDECAVMELVD